MIKNAFSYLLSALIVLLLFELVFIAYYFVRDGKYLSVPDTWSQEGNSY